ncbi:HNH endonuclease family protein [Nocardiopsis sp. LOL_012]|uniref:HNH endonuclease family protein n=1 Tax=Nocardiopsis sp. LOL_012 TaxID=3345409 RepID=UPI003A89FF54
MPDRPTAGRVLAGLAGVLLLTSGCSDLSPSDLSDVIDLDVSQAPTDSQGGGSGSSDPGSALALLDELRVEEADPPGYDRSLFPHWESGLWSEEAQDDCTARQVVLLRDGENVEVDEDCQPVSGTWYSEYDGETFTEAGDLDIDHMVPLAEAWRSGADTWTTEERERFANDLDTSPQLWAVSASSNRSKSDEDPGEWLPPLESFHCEYAAAWIEVKHTWDLAVNSAEEAALREVLSGC